MTRRDTYLVIAHALRLRLVRLPPKTLIYSEGGLRKTYGVSRSTVRRALLVLKAEGLLESVPGVGWRTRGVGAEESETVLPSSHD